MFTFRKGSAVLILILSLSSCGTSVENLRSQARDKEHQGEIVALSSQLPRCSSIVNQTITLLIGTEKCRIYPFNLNHLSSNFGVVVPQTQGVYESSMYLTSSNYPSCSSITPIDLPRTFNGVRCMIYADNSQVPSAVAVSEKSIQPPVESPSCRSVVTKPLTIKIGTKSGRKLCQIYPLTLDALSSSFGVVVPQTQGKYEFNLSSSVYPSCSSITQSDIKKTIGGVECKIYPENSGGSPEMSFSE